MLTNNSMNDSTSGIMKDSSSSSSSAAAAEQPLQKKQRMMEALAQQRENLEMEAQAITLELNSPGPNGEAPMGVDTPLTDRDGYPRGDIDVYRARSLRGRLAVLKTDLRRISKEMESVVLNQSNDNSSVIQNSDGSGGMEAEELAKRLAPKPKPKFDPVSGKWVVKNWDGTVAGAENGENRRFDQVGAKETSSSEQANKRDDDTMEDEQVASSSMKRQLSLSSQTEERISEVHGGDASMMTQRKAEELRPFAQVNGVAIGSPASEAGLQQGDLIVQFGPNINFENHRNLMAIGALVPAVAGERGSIRVHIVRGSTSSPLVVQLQPKPWSGRGLLGCHIVPYTDDR